MMCDNLDSINGVIASIDGEPARIPFESVDLIPDDQPWAPDFLALKDELVRFSANVVFDSNIKKMINLLLITTYDFRSALRAHHHRRCPWGARYR